MSEVLLGDSAAAAQTRTRRLRLAHKRANFRSRNLLPGTRKNSPAELLICVSLSVLVLYAGKDFFVPVTLAILLSFMAGRGLRFLESCGVSSRISAAALSCAVVGAFVLSAWLVATQLSNVSTSMPLYRITLHRKLIAVEATVRSVVDQLQVLRSPRDLTRNVPASVTSGAQAPVAAAPNSLSEVQDFAPWLLHYLALSAFVLVLAIFLAVYRDNIRDRIVRLAGQRNIHIASELLDEVALKVSAFLWTQLVLNACFGTITAVIFYTLGLQYAALWGTLLGVLRFIPFIGVIIGASMPVFFALATSPSWSMAVTVLASIVLIDFFLTQFVEPKVIGARIGLSPVAVLISAFAWTCLWGPAGLLLATPLTTCLVVAGRYIPRLAFTSILFSDEQVLTPPLQLYHRALSKGELSSDPWLTAHIEAVGAETFLSESFLPALALLARDRNRRTIPSPRVRHACSVLRSILPLVEEKLPPPAEALRKDMVFVLVPMIEDAEALAAEALRCLGTRLGGTWQVLERGNTVLKVRQATNRSRVNAVIFCTLNSRPINAARYFSPSNEKNAPLEAFVYQLAEVETGIVSSTQDAHILKTPRDFRSKIFELLNKPAPADQAIRA